MGFTQFKTDSQRGVRGNSEEARAIPNCRITRAGAASFNLAASQLFTDNGIDGHVNLFTDSGRKAVGLKVVPNGDDLGHSRKISKIRSSKNKTIRQVGIGVVLSAQKLRDTRGNGKHYKVTYDKRSKMVVIDFDKVVSA